MDTMSVYLDTFLWLRSDLEAISRHAGSSRHFVILRGLPASRKRLERHGRFYSNHISYLPVLRRSSVFKFMRIHYLAISRLIKTLSAGRPLSNRAGLVRRQSLKVPSVALAALKLPSIMHKASLVLLYSS